MLLLKLRRIIMKAVVTVIGVDKVGIIAGVSKVLAQYNVNIMDITQTIMQEYFTMIMLVDLSRVNISFDELKGILMEEGKRLGVEVRVQREDIFKSMHQI
jgi:ACT domain-containing protein